MGLIRLENMEFYAFHGHFEEEQVVGNRFQVDLILDTNMKKAAKSDNLGDAADYQIAYHCVKDEMGKPAQLLEHVASRILHKVFDLMDNINTATVKVSKLNPSMGGKMGAVSVELSMDKTGIK